ncbi:FAD-dependent oxidoreductase [Sandarakinorhabdus sp. DWP1-3-1]|uniref:FAD-dependent oxidoreductase n=1 Tax=Sandarakinorhabdus sp. DWP1-3-1 TaxID=2804627 RepID=UPI003CF86730
MRVDLPGVTRTGVGFAMSFAGRPVTGFAGESVAAALVNAGELVLRDSAAGDGRGVHCGMGICGECAVVVDGTVRRACMTAAAAGMAIAPAPARAAAAAPDPVPALADIDCDVIVIGAGPAGLAASRMAARCGLNVVCIDERAKAGGQYYKQPGAGFAVDPRRVDTQFADGAALASSTALAGVRCLFAATAWLAEQDGEAVRVAVSSEAGALWVRGRRLIIASGAHERPWPVPGWTLPGVMTTGGAQTLLRSGLTAPGTRVLVAGNGPLNVQLAHELVRAGVSVVALVEQAEAPGAARIGAALTMAATAPDLVGDGLRQLAALRRAGVVRLNRHVLVRVEGDGRAQAAVVAPIGSDGRPGTARRFDVDAVCIGAGFVPQSELARALGCAHDWRDGVLAVRRDDDGRTSVASVFVAGDGGGLGGARVALAQGVLAGAAAARDLVGALPSEETHDARRATGQLRRARRFQAALWDLFAPVPLAGTLATAETLLCRCESVSHGTIAALLADGITDIGSLKRASRAGMGRCQGRYCGPLLMAMVAEATGRPPGDDDGFAPRPPLRPVSIAAIAGA